MDMLFMMSSIIEKLLGSYV